MPQLEPMPDDRLLHPRMGYSQKVSGLTDFNFRVWIVYLLAADDFGVMPLSAGQLKAKDLRLAKAKDHELLAALETLIDVGLLWVFTHQGERYVCSPVWQDRQRIRFPRKTFLPAPPTELLGNFSEATRELFGKHSEKSPSLSRPVNRLTANANGSGTSEEESDEAKDALAERAGAFLERYQQLYAKTQHGAFYPLKPSRDYHYALDLVRHYDDSRLATMAELYLLRDDREVQGKTRTVGQFASMAPWCDARLREAGR
jgi:hypothetical protein